MTRSQSGNSPLPNNELRNLSGLLGTGDFNAVIERCRELLDEHGANPDVLSILGIARHQAGDGEGAAGAWRAALESNPKHFDANNNLGVALKNSGDLAGAIKHLGAAHQASPERLDVCLNLAGCYRSKKELKNAVRVLQKSLPLAEDKVPILQQLANIALEVEDQPHSELYLNQLLELREESPSANHALGSVLKDQSRFLESIPYLERAVELAPDDATFMLSLGSVYARIDQAEQAQRCYERAIEIEPDSGPAQRLLGALAVYRGDKAAALKIYKAHIQRHPRCAATHLSLSITGSYEAGDPHIGTMEALVQDESLDEEDRCKLDFALFNAWDKAGDVDKAFIHLERGNARRRKLIPYNIADTREATADLKERFSQPLESLPPADHSPRPVLVVGMPRSGTSLTEQILAAHSAVYGAGELYALNRLAGPARSREGVPRDLLASIRAGYYQELDRLNSPYPVVVDKMPENFWLVGYTILAMPEVRIVQLERDPIATCWSIYRTYFSESGLGYGYGLESLVQHYRCFQEIMAFWKSRFPEKIYTLNYEALTENPESIARDLLEFVGLDFEPGCLDFAGSGRLVNTASALQLANGIYSGSSQAWKRYESKLDSLTGAFATNPAPTTA